LASMTETLWLRSLRALRLPNPKSFLSITVCLAHIYKSHILTYNHSL
jgi:hypothetical protein